MGSLREKREKQILEADDLTDDILLETIHNLYETTLIRQKTVLKPNGDKNTTIFSMVKKYCLFPGCSHNFATPDTTRIPEMLVSFFKLE